MNIVNDITLLSDHFLHLIIRFLSLLQDSALFRFSKTFSLSISLCLSVSFLVIVIIKDIRVIGISGSLICSKTLMKLIFNPCDEFRWSPEGPVSQIHSPHLHAGAPGIFSDFLRSVQMLKREWVWKETGSYCTYSYLVKLQPRFLSLQWKTCLWAKLRPWFLSLQWRTCTWAEYSDDDFMHTRIN